MESGRAVVTRIVLFGVALFHLELFHLGMELSKTQTQALKLFAVGSTASQVEAVMQSNHFLNALRSLERKGLILTTYSGAHYHRSLTEAGKAAVASL